MTFLNWQISDLKKRQLSGWSGLYPINMLLFRVEMSERACSCWAQAMRHVFVMAPDMTILEQWLELLNVLFWVGANGAYRVSGVTKCCRSLGFSRADSDMTVTRNHIPSPKALVQAWSTSGDGFQQLKLRDLACPVHPFSQEPSCASCRIVQGFLWKGKQTGLCLVQR